VHDQGEESLVDFNRAGVPLMELVTEPVIHDSKEAGLFARELQLLLRTLRVSDANMEKGEMRVEANISVSKTDELGTKVEVKNLNSFKVVEAAIEYETKRHIEELEAGRQLVQETRGWDENKSKTFSQRSKETAQDYRYFPDPDIPKFMRSEIPEFTDSRLNEILPETPHSKRSKLLKLGLDEKQIEIIIADIERDSFFRACLESLDERVHPTLAANYLTSDIASLIEKEGLSLSSASPQKFSALLALVSENRITSRVAKDLLKEVVFEGLDGEKIATERGLLQQNSEDAVQAIVATVIAENPEVVAEYKAGKDASIQYLVGQGMKLSRGSANPALLRTLLEKAIKS